MNPPGLMPFGVSGLRATLQYKVTFKDILPQSVGLALRIFSPVSSFLNLKSSIVQTGKNKLRNFSNVIPFDIT